MKAEMKIQPEVEAAPTPPKPPTVMIATPMYGGMCTGEYTEGVIQATGLLRQLGYGVFFARAFNESLITRARNDLARLFIEGGYDYLMFIDADIGFDAQAITALIASDRDIACGIYPKKEIAWDSVERAIKDGRENPAEYAGTYVFNMLGGGHAETDHQGMIEIKHGGTGFMLIKRKVFLGLMPHVPTYRASDAYNTKTQQYLKPLTHEFFATSINEHGVLLSEDYHFCDLWRKHGGKIYANPFLKLRHVGTHVFSGDITKSGGNLR